MKLILFLFLFVTACKSPVDGGSDDQVATAELATSVYRCDSKHVDQVESLCLMNNVFSVSIVKRIAQWRPDQGSWLSLQLQSVHFKNEYSMTKEQSNCLIKKLCKEKIP